MAISSDADHKEDELKQGVENKGDFEKPEILDISTMEKILAMLEKGDTKNLAVELANVRHMAKWQALHFASYFGNVGLFPEKPFRFEMQYKNVGSPRRPHTAEASWLRGQYMSQQKRKLQKEKPEMMVKSIEADIMTNWPTDKLGPCPTLPTLKRDLRSFEEETSHNRLSFKRANE